jgi:hypothetical protein
MNKNNAISIIYIITLTASIASAAEVPRAEHPRPDAARALWANLNGRWEFRFDPADLGLNAGWEKPGASGFDRTIVVPFPWESELSEIHESQSAPKIAWYRRSFRVPAVFPTAERVWLNFGAVDYHAQVWINGHKVADHEGGYTPFEADITGAITRDGENVLVVRVFDPTDPSLPTGKQVNWYTPSSGIWQTVWLEARPRTYIAGFQVITSIDPASARFVVDVAGCDNAPYALGLDPVDPSVQCKPVTFAADPKTVKEPNTPAGHCTVSLNATVLDPELWTPEHPRLYTVTLELKTQSGKVIDSVQTYFGLRTIARGTFGNQPIERLLLNGKPLYLRAALDQSFNPKGLYTAPDDEFLKRDLVIAKEMGLNALRIHIKPDEPRRLYWADKLGVLILEDMPNTWTQSARARTAWEHTMREAVTRDRNHPALIAWVAFNETWGLGKPETYKSDRDTQDWVSRMVDQIRALDGQHRLVEDNSPCNYDHVVNNDINSWHFYIDDHDQARRHIEGVVERSQPGTSFNYCTGLKQQNLPLINSEYGAVSAGGGDRDISWGLRDLTTQLRRHKKIQGFVYTELADIEWEHNGLVNYDRTLKAFGYDNWVPNMTPADLLGADFIGYDTPPAIVAKPGETITIPLFVSHYSERSGPVRLRTWASGRDRMGDIRMFAPLSSVAVAWRAYDVVNLEPLRITLPDEPLVGAVSLVLYDDQNRRIAANFVNIVVKPDRPIARVERRGPHEAIVRFSPADFASQGWREPPVVTAAKVYGLGAGFFEYKLTVPAAIARANPETITVWLQAASKAARQKVDWPSKVNREDYPQTDAARQWPSSLAVSINGRPCAAVELPDDPADARGVLSHLAKIDHGSYGDVVDFGFELTDDDRDQLRRGLPLTLHLAVPEDAPNKGGLCVFGATAGALPLEPSIQFHTRDPLPADMGVDPDAPVARKP